MRGNVFLVLLAGLGLVLPAGVSAKGTSASYEGLLAQAPPPPKDSAAAALRWIEDSKSDKSSVDLMAKLKSLQGQSGSDVKSGNQKYADMAKQMEGMSQAEKIAAAMKMAKEMQADRQKTFNQTGGNAYGGAYQDVQAGQQLSKDVTKTSGDLKALDDEFAPQFKKIEDDFFTQFHNCPEGKTGYPLESCSKPLEAQYHKDYVKLEDKKLVKKSAILAQLKAALIPKIQEDEARIAELNAASTDDAKQQIGLKKMDSLELIQSYVQMVTDMVEEGYKAENTELKY